MFIYKFFNLLYVGLYFYFFPVLILILVFMFGDGAIKSDDD